MYGDTDVVKKSAHLFDLKLYGNFDGNLDEARAHAFSTTKEDLRCFPPTEDAFHDHMLCALFPILICKAAQRITHTWPPLHHLGEKFVVKNWFQSRWTSHPDLQQQLRSNAVHVSRVNAQRDAHVLLLA